MRKIAQELEFGRRVEKRKQGLISIRNVKDYVAYRDKKLSRLKPVVLDSPKFSNSGDEKDADDVGESREGLKSSSRVAPRNPKLAVYGGTLDDISKFFSMNDDPKAAKNPQEQVVEDVLEQLDRQKDKKETKLRAMATLFGRARNCLKFEIAYENQFVMNTRS